MESYVGEQDGYFGIFSISEKGKVSFEPCGRCVYINDLIEVHETKEVLMDLEFDYNGRAVYITLPRGNYK
jgi:hypothetical protein